MVGGIRPLNSSPCMAGTKDILCQATRKERSILFTVLIVTTRVNFFFKSPLGRDKGLTDFYISNAIPLWCQRKDFTMSIIYNF